MEGEGGWAVGMEHEGKLRMRSSIQYVEEEGYLGSCKGESTSSRGISKGEGGEGQGRGAGVG